MDEFDRRKKGFDKFFALSEALRFKALSRRNRAVGEWAAEKLGLTGEAARALRRSLRQGADRRRNDDEALIARLHDEFVKAGVDVSAHRIRRKFEAAMNDAIAEIEAGK